MAPADMRSGAPCMRGTGFTAFRFHYTRGGGTHATIDAFGLPDGKNFEVDPIFISDLSDDIHGGGLDVTDSSYILIRYSVAGLAKINSATFSIFGRSYDVSASGSFRAWTPIHGEQSSAPDSVSNAWPYDWTSVDFTGLVDVGDDPGLTGIRLYGGPSSGSVVVHTVELCIDGS